MDVKIIKHTYRLKRATAARWIEINPILDQGEPGYVLDTHQLKIGDGITPWTSLPYIDGMEEVIILKDNETFPKKGNANSIYIKNKQIYQYNPQNYKYEILAQEDFAKVAKTGNINDIIQNKFDILILDCGGAE